jgi:acetyl esterase/lipase
VQAVACFFPPTDFLNWGKDGEDAVGIGLLKNFKPAFGPRSDKAEDRMVLGKEISPINFVTPNTAPTMIIHGDLDRLVPIQQARVFEERCRKENVPFKLIVKEGKDHGWREMDKDVALCADWFDEHLRKSK